MDLAFRDDFLAQWRHHFPGAEPPLAFFFTGDPSRAESPKPARGHRCLIADLARARRGTPVRFDAGSVACAGGRRYLGLARELRPDFEYFLSCGIPGKVEGERYKRTPELVREMLRRAPCFQAPAPNAVFVRWDRLEAGDEPEVAIFFARPDVLAGLFTLANFDEAESSNVVAPFGAGCASIVQHPYLERDAARPRCFLGMFDVSARPHVPADTLTFALPIRRLREMHGFIDESFLRTRAWQTIRARLARH
ncbi:MAG: DUF169 domain-containing protein [Myxococcales bacterium]|nr:DUF169 domain-containing protein [Myxococcales bacterium]